MLPQPLPDRYVRTGVFLAPFHALDENPTLAIEVSQDEKPIVYAASMQPVIPYWSLAVLSVLGKIGDILDLVKPALDVYDAHAGTHLRTVDHVASFATSLQQP